MKRNIIIFAAFSLFLLIMMPNISAIEHDQIMKEIDEKQSEIMDMFQSTKVDILDLIKGFPTLENNSTYIEELRVFLSLILLPFTLPLCIPFLLHPLIKIPAGFIYNLYSSIPDIFINWIIEVFGFGALLIFLPILVWLGVVYNVGFYLFIWPMVLFAIFYELLTNMLMNPLIICIEMINCQGTKTVDEIRSEIEYHSTFP